MMQGRRQRSNNPLERCARWLLSIPREDELLLQTLPEYANFIAAFEQLEIAHHGAIADDYNRYSQSQETESSIKTISLQNISNDSSDCVPHNRVESGHSYVTRNWRPSFLQHRALDEVIIKVFEYLTVSSLVCVASTCHRLRQMVYLTAHQLTRDLPITQYLNGTFTTSAVSTLRYYNPRSGAGQERQRAVSDTVAQSTSRHRDTGVITNRNMSRSPPSNTINTCDSWEDFVGIMKLLRAKEQMLGMSSQIGPFVRIPLLGLEKRVVVTGSGDEDFNGIYFCTGFNGNGFVFTKPRNPTGSNRRTLAGNRNRTLINANENNLEDILDESDDDVGSAIPGRNNESNDLNGFLRCIIARRYSHDRLLWYIGKEVYRSPRGTVGLLFTFWADLMIASDTDEFRYPSQTSTLTRRGGIGWQSLLDNIAPPVVELID